MQINLNELHIVQKQKSHPFQTVKDVTKLNFCFQQLKNLLSSKMEVSILKYHNSFLASMENYLL